MVDRRILPYSQFAADSNIIVNRGTGFEMVQASGDEMMNPSMMRLGWWYNRASQDQSQVEYRYASTSEGATPVTPSGAKAMNAGCAMDDRQIMMMMPGLSLGSPFGVSSKEIAEGGGYRMVTTDSGFELVFGIRPILDRIRPGDDILITVSIKNLRDEAVFTATVPATDYLAVYDKKLLWRANLYVQYREQFGFTKENPPKPIMKDWNDQNPWNAPVDSSVAIEAFPAWGKNDAGTAWVWGYNDWNVVGWNRETGSSLGGQMTAIRPWTRWNDNATVSGNVAYGWGCWDSVGGFNDELVQQAQLVGNLRNKTVYDPDTGRIPNPLYLGDQFRYLPWIDGQTTAPGGNWNNYVFPKRRLASNGLYYYASTMTQEQIDTVVQHAYSINGSAVSVPGLSTMCKYGGTDYYGSTPVSDSASRTSGTDCSGLAHRVTKYPGSVYYMATHDYDMSDNDAEDDKFNTTAFAGTATVPDTERTWQIHLGEWVIDKKDNDVAYLEARDLQRKTASLAVPGDLLVVGGSHVVIVHDLQYLPGSEVITAYDQVKVIHSTGMYGHWRVEHAKWVDVHDTKTPRESYQLRRYR